MNEGITDLSLLLREMNPVIKETDLVFSKCEDAQQIGVVPSLYQFAEDEGITIVTKQHIAEKHNLKNNGKLWTRITLQVYSSLEAVGFIAKISSELAKHGISTNVVSAFHHDHILVPTESSDIALRILRDIIG